VAKKRSKFDPKTFLSTIDGGRKLAPFPKKQAIFVQGDSSDAVFYIQKGKVKPAPVRARGRIGGSAGVTLDGGAKT